jgi:hypothetical protein
VNRTFFYFGSDVETGGKDQEWIRLCKSVLAVKPFEIDTGCGNCRLAKRDLSSEFMNERAEIDVKGEDIVGRKMIFRMI